MLLETLNELYQELREKHAQSSRLIEGHVRVVNQARASLNMAKEEEACAVHEDEEVNMKINDLRHHCNALINPPQVLLDKIATLNEELVDTVRKREDAARIVQRCQQELKKEETQLKIAEENRAKLGKGLQDVLDEMQKVHTQS